MKPFHTVLNNTVICMLNSKYIHSSLAPWYLLAGIDAYCNKPISAEVVEGTVNMALQDFAARIIEKSPKVIGLCCYIWNITYIKKLLPVIKSAVPEAVIILGGPEVSYNAGDILQNEPLVDYVLAGEGELPFARLVDAVITGGDVSGIPGVCYRNGGSVVVAPPYCPSEDPPNPYTELYFKALNGRIAYLETSRGCPFSCTFCLSGRKQLALRADGGVRYFNLERAKCDLLLLAQSGTQTIKLVDRTFNADRKRALEIFRFVIDNTGDAIPKGVRFHFEIAGDLLDDETLERLRTAPEGLFQLEIGLQSFNEKTLDAIKRKTDITRLKQNIERLISFGTVHVHIDLIAGLPFEDIKSFADSFNTAYALCPHMLQLGFLKLLHGSAMREDTSDSRHSSDPPYEVLETPWMTADQLRRLHSAEDALERLYNSGRFRRTLSYVLEKTGLTPFELFQNAGSFIAENIAGQVPLDSFAGLIYDYCASLAGVDKMTLRDAMVCDRLATNASGKLPETLKIPDSRLKAVMTAVNTNPETRQQKGVKRGFALLHSQNAAVYVDYTEKHPVTEEYQLNIIPW